MYSSVFLALAAFVICMLLTPGVRRLALRFGVVDQLETAGRGPSTPIARGGGVAVCLSFVAAFVLLLATPLGAGMVVREGLPLIWKLLPAAALVFLTGLVDDIWNMRPWQKLLGQLGAAALACWAGLRIVGVAGYEIPAWLGVPLTIAWLAGCTNAFNLIDGLDGLAAGLGFCAALTMLVAAVIQNNVALALATAPLAGCLLAFLWYNFNPASIFLGDSGSLLIGFLLGCYGVIWSQKAATLLGLTAPLMALAIPLLDTGIAVMRRYLRNRPIFVADRGHIHHRLLDRGFTPRRVALVLYGCAAVAAGFSLLQNSVRDGLEHLVLLLFCGAILAGIYHMRFVELDVARQILFTGALRRMIDAHVALRTLKDSLAAARTVEQCWEVIREGSRQFGFVQVRLTLLGRVMEERFRDSRPEKCWQLQIPLSGNDRIEFEHNQHYVGPAMIGPFIDVVCRELQLKRDLEAEPAPATATAAAGSGTPLVNDYAIPTRS